MTHLLRPLLLLALCLTALPALATGIEGRWVNDTEEAHIQIAPCEDKLCGAIVWMKEPNTEDGEPKTDRDNPDESLRGQPILGLTILKDFPTTPNKKGMWTGGTIYDPQNGKTYSCQITPDGDDELKIRGYLGFSLLGRTTVWTRAPEGEATTAE